MSIHSISTAAQPRRLLPTWTMLACFLMSAPLLAQQPDSQPAGVILFEHKDFQGAQETFYASDASLRDNLIGNDSATSMRVAPGCRVLLYRHDDFQGKSQEINADVRNLRDTHVGNDELSSLEVFCERIARETPPAPAGPQPAAPPTTPAQALSDPLPTAVATPSAPAPAAAVWGAEHEAAFDLFEKLRDQADQGFAGVRRQGQSARGYQLFRESLAFAHDAVGDLQLELGRDDQAQASFGRANNALGPSAADEPERRVDTLRRFLIVAWRQGDPDQARQYQQLIAYLGNPTGQPDLGRIADLHRSLGEIEAELQASDGDTEPAEILEQRRAQIASDIATAWSSRRRVAMAEAWWRLARLAELQGDVGATRQLARRALDSWSRWPPAVASAERLATQLRFHLDLSFDDLTLTTSYDEALRLIQIHHRLHGAAPNTPPVASATPESGAQIEQLTRQQLAARGEKSRLEDELATATRELTAAAATDQEVFESGPYQGKTAEQAAIERRLGRLRSDLEFVDLRLANLHQKLADLGVEIAEVDGQPTGLLSTDEARQLLQQGEALLAYATFDDATYHLVLRPDGAQGRKIGNGLEEIAGEADAEHPYGQLMQHFMGTHPQIVSGLEPLLTGIDKLYVVPDPAVGAVPMPPRRAQPTATRQTLRLATVTALRSPTQAQIVELPANPTLSPEMQQQVMASAMSELFRQMSEMQVQVERAERRAEPPDLERRATVDTAAAIAPSQVLQAPGAPETLSVAYDPAGRFVASGHADHHLRLWHPNGALQAAHDLGGKVWSLASSGNGAKLAAVVTSSAGFGGGFFASGLRVIEPLTGESVLGKALTLTRVRSLAFAPDGEHLIATSNSVGQFKMGFDEDRMTAAFSRWHLATGERQSYLGGEEAVVLAWSPDGRQIVSGNEYDSLTLWDAASGEELLRLAGAHEDSIKDVAFHPGGQTIASASADGSVKLWRVADGRSLMSLRHVEGKVRKVAFSPDGRWLASAGADGRVLIWNPDRGDLVATLVVDDDLTPLRQIAWDAAATGLVGATDSGGLYRWEIPGRQTAERSGDD